MIRYTIKPSKGDRSGFYRYEDDYAKGLIFTRTEGTVGIYQWSTKDKEKGGTRKSLKNLRDLYGYITVHDIGFKGDDSYSYWVKMKGEGLVDDIYDDDMNLVQEVVERVLRRFLKESTQKLEVKTISQEEMERLEWDNKVVVKDFFTGGIGDIYFHVAMVDDMVVGIAKVWKGNVMKFPFHSISMIKVAPEYSGKGYASMLVDEMFRFAKERGFTLGVHDYTKDGWQKMKPLFNEKARQYGVEFIDTDSKLMNRSDKDWG